MVERERGREKEKEREIERDGGKVWRSGGSLVVVVAIASQIP